MTYHILTEISFKPLFLEHRINLRVAELFVKVQLSMNEIQKQVINHLVELIPLVFQGVVRGGHDRSQILVFLELLV